MQATLAFGGQRQQLRLPGRSRSTFVMRGSQPPGWPASACVDQALSEPSEPLHTSMVGRRWASFSQTPWPAWAPPLPTHTTLARSPLESRLSSHPGQGNHTSEAPPPGAPL